MNGSFQLVIQYATSSDHSHLLRLPPYRAETKSRFLLLIPELCSTNYVIKQRHPVSSSSWPHSWSIFPETSLYIGSHHVHVYRRRRLYGCPSLIQRMLLWRRLVCCSLVNDDPDNKNPSGSTDIPALLLQHCLAPVRSYPASYRRLLAHGISAAVYLTIRDEGSRASCRQDDLGRYEHGTQATCYRPLAEERIDTISVPHNC